MYAIEERIEKIRVTTYLTDGGWLFSVEDTESILVEWQQEEQISPKTNQKTIDERFY